MPRARWAPRESIQMTARMSGRPRSSTGTVPDHWALHPTPATRPGTTPLSPRTRRVPRTTASHQSAGSCSTPPPPTTCSGYRSTADPTSSPRTPVTATLTPDVPRSTARIQSPVPIPGAYRTAAGGVPGRGCSAWERCGTVRAKEADDACAGTPVVKPARTSIRLADGRELIYFDEHEGIDRTDPDTRDLGVAVTSSQIRCDPLTEEWVIGASHRRGRTHLPR